MDSIYMNTAISIFLIIFVKIFVNSITKGNKKLPPGPPALPILGHLHLLKQPLHHALHEKSKQYGPAVSLRFVSVPVLLVSNHTLAEKCFTTHDLAFSNRVHLPTVKMQSGLIGFANYGSYWLTVCQAAVLELLSGQKVQAFSQFRAQEIRGMARQLFRSRMIFQLTMDAFLIKITGKRAYGENIDASDDVKKFSETLIGWFILIGVSNIEDFLPLLRILDMKGTMKKMRNIVKVNSEMAQKLIDENRHEGLGTRKTMIKGLLELQQQDSETYKDEVIKDIVVTMMLVGTETTSTTLEWAMAELLNNPEVLKKAKIKIDERIGSKRLVQESDMDNLPYINCIINEILRLHPAVPVLPAHAAREDDKLEDYNIPKGTMLLVNIYPIQTDPELWEKPTKFMPERFENGNSNGKMVIPFGMGRRKCPGEALAMRMMVHLLGTLIQCLEWKRLGEELIDLTEGSGLTTPLATPLEVMYQPRKVMKEVLLEL